MGISGEIALAAAKKYTAESLIGGGALKGKNCTIKSITEITGGHRVTFEWTLDDGTVQTNTMDVMDGVAPAGSYVDKDQFDDNFTTIAGGNLLELTDGVYKTGNVTAVVKDNIITLNGTVSANNYLYIKVSNGFAIAEATGRVAVPDAWAAETVSILENGKQYAFSVFTLGGTISSSAAGPSMTLKDNAKNTIQSADTLFTYSGGGAFLQLVCGKESVFNNLQMACMVTENAVPAQFTNKELALQAYDNLWKQYVYKLANENSFISIKNSDYSSSSSIYCQGSCVVGNNLFIVFMTNSHTYINKYSLSDGSLIDSAQMDAIHHGNDLTYNPYDGYIYAVDLDSPNVIHKITIDLEYVSYVEVALTDVYPGYTGIGAIDFNASRGLFVCLLRGNRKGYALLDVNLSLVDIVWTRNCGGQYGGIVTDNNFIYQAAAEPSMIHVLGFNGKYIGRLFDLGKLSVEDTSRWEPESLSIVGDKIYIAYNSPLHNTKTYVDAFDISQRIYGFLPKI